MIRRILTGLVLAGVLALPAPARAETGTDTKSILSRAESAYDRGITAMATNPAQSKAAFAESAAAYRELAEERGVRNASLLANLGNAYLLSGDAGRAVLSYRRAERIDPTSPTVRAGLDLVRSRVGSVVEAGASRRTMDWLTGWRRVVAPGSLLVIGVWAWGAGWLALAMARRRPAVRRLARGGIAAAVVGALCIAAVLADNAVWRASPAAVLVESGVVGRKGPGGAAYEPSFDKPLGAGVELTIAEERGDWLRVRLGDGRETWVPRSALERV